MKFDVLDEKMRVFETSHDHCVLPGMYMIARLDGRGFSKLTRTIIKRKRYESPFADWFHGVMQNTVVHLMTCGFRIVYANTHSDEISLLFHKDENSFGRKLRKLESVLAGEASAKISLDLNLNINKPAVFDCRISQLPNKNLVIDYFRWRQEDAMRNALNSYCYWMLRDQGLSPAATTSKLKNVNTRQKFSLLSENGVNFEQVDAWEKLGTGFYWEGIEKKGKNPLTGEISTVIRRKITVNENLPKKEDYKLFLGKIIDDI